MNLAKPTSVPAPWDETNTPIAGCMLVEVCKKSKCCKKYKKGRMCKKCPKR